MSSLPMSTLLPSADDAMKGRVPIPSASLTIRQIQEKIPPQYFHRSLTRSLLYLLRDLSQLALTYYLMSALLLPALSALPLGVFGGVVRLLLWGLFWFVQGLNGTALWVLAHECGHQAFSPSKGVNDAIGLLLHSALLVPYHGWRLAHGRHHKHTNHLTKDTVFVPETRPHVTAWAEESPLVSLCMMAAMFLFGWPAHLLANASGQSFGRRTNHFEPSSPLFQRADYNDVVVSNIGMATALVALWAAAHRFGWVAVWCWYGAPYLWVNFWLVYITFLQHTDVRIPHYAHTHWTFPRGAVAAVDRDYGWALNEWLHHINDSHVVHHLFSQMPHYHAIAVTRGYIRDILGEMYVTDARPLWVSLYETWRECKYVIPSEGVCVFRY